MSVVPHFQPKSMKQYVIMMAILVILAVGSLVASIVSRTSSADKTRRSASLQKAKEYHKADKDPQAIEVLKSALAEEDRLGHAEDPSLVHVLDMLGELLLSEKRSAEAEAVWRRALALRLKSVGSEHPEVLDTSDKLASALKAEKKFPEAEGLLVKSLAKREEWRESKDDPVLLGSINRLAELYIAQERWGDAEKHARRAVAIGRASMGLVPPALADSLRDLGTVLAAQAKDAEAEPLLRRALAMREQAPDTAPEVIAAAQRSL
ncbi:MAG TPA: tetratricopeptide repeat protein, partial [Planctomycetota bacterium]|nr:tetratricopeptide repeat protein [Planctomycetota bacterium]